MENYDDNTVSLYRRYKNHGWVYRALARIGSHRIGIGLTRHRDE